jgi:hypothetical protein
MKWNLIKKWLLMAVIQTGTVLLYFLGIRPLRVLFSEWVGSAIFQLQSESVDYIESVVRVGVTIDTTFIFQGTELVFSYAPQFGFFFLISVFGLNFLRPGIRIYLLLIIFHAFIELVSLGFTAVAFNGFPIGFVIADFLLLYLSPLVSLGFILFVILQKNGKLGGRLS